MIGIIKFVSFLVKSFEKNLKYLLTNLLIDVYCQSVINLVRSKFDILLGNALVDFSKFRFFHVHIFNFVMNLTFRNIVEHKIITDV